MPPSPLTHDALKEFIVEQRQLFLQTDRSIDREVLHETTFADLRRLREVLVITGIRRCGKSYLMKLAWKQWQKETPTAANNYLYCNFEHEKMLHFGVGDFDRLLECYEEVANPSPEHLQYLFFDEIQNIRGWEKFVSRMQADRRYKVIVTGSNASLLSREIASALTGRSITLTLYPLSFREFAHHRLGTSIASTGLHRRDARIAMRRQFEAYLTTGGFPEVVLQDFRPLLQEYLQNILYRDIVTRHRLKHEASLRELVAFLMANIGTVLSLEQIARMTRIKSLMTVKNYLSYLEDAFLFLRIPRHSYSIKRQIYNPDKIYAIDTGLYHEVAFVNSANRGRILENIVCLELRRRSADVYYFQGKKECDFIVQTKNRVTQAIQVTQGLAPHNRERELAGLDEAIRTYDLEEGLVLTEGDQDRITEGRRTIMVRPIWEWCLDRPLSHPAEGR